MSSSLVKFLSDIMEAPTFLMLSQMWYNFWRRSSETISYAWTKVADGGNTHGGCSAKTTRRAVRNHFGWYPEPRTWNDMMAGLIVELEPSQMIIEMQLRRWYNFYDFKSFLLHSFQRPLRLNGFYSQQAGSKEYETYWALVSAKRYDPDKAVGYQGRVRIEPFVLSAIMMIQAPDIISRVMKSSCPCGDQLVEDIMTYKN